MKIVDPSKDYKNASSDFSNQNRETLAVEDKSIGTIIKCFDIIND